jgi:quercetin dioxygenase-like cupin family protein
MARPHLKFVDSNTVPWQPIGDHGLKMQVLSQDPDTGAMTFLLDIPKGWKGGGVAHYHSVSEEVFMISGDVSLDGVRFYHGSDYLYRPGNIVHGHDEQSREGGRAIVKLGGTLDFSYVHEPASPEEYVLPGATLDRPHVQFLTVDEAPWEERGEGPNRSRRTVLSRNPETGATTTLIEFPPGWRGRAGAHYHSRSEEVFVLSGDVALDDEPIYREGCYLYRPGGIMHGPKERSEGGCRMLIFADEGPLDFNYAKDMADPRSVPWE